MCVRRLAATPKRATQNSKERLRNCPLLLRILDRRKVLHQFDRVQHIIAVPQLFTRSVNRCGMMFFNFEARDDCAAKTCPPFGILRRQQMNQSTPVLKMFPVSCGAVCTPAHSAIGEGSPLYPSACPISPASEASSCRMPGGTALRQPRQPGTDWPRSSARSSLGNTVPSRKSSSNCCFPAEPTLPTDCAAAASPSTAARSRKATIAMQQHSPQCGIQLRIVAAKLHQRLVSPLHDTSDVGSSTGVCRPPLT